MVNFRHFALALGAIPQLALSAPMPVATSATAVTDSYIIVLKDEVTNDDVNAHLDWVEDVHRRSLTKRDTGGIGEKFNIDKFRAYAGQFDEGTLDEIKKDPKVAKVEPDYTMSLYDVTEQDESSDTTVPLTERGKITQSDAPWGLSALSSRAAGSTSFTYDTKAGAGTYGYIVDSGINFKHVEFGGRAIHGYNGVKGTPNTDTIGHGTHVAGLIGGSTYGVAKKAKLISVKVFQGQDAKTSAILAGFNWAYNDIVKKGRQNKAVINMSLGGPASDVWATAINAAFRRGVLTVVAAGNGDANGNAEPVSVQSPANVPNALTVGAIDSNWKPAAFSNYGSSVDIMAPGVKILSAWYDSKTSTRTMSGTSMATPFVSGVALYLQSLGSIKGPAALTKRIKSLGTKQKISGSLNGSPNVVAFKGN